MVGAVRPPKIFGQIVRCDFIHQTGPEQGVIQFAAAFAEQAFDAPFPPQPAQCGAKIDFVPAANFHLVGHGSQLAQLRFRCPPGGQNDDGRETMFENFRAGIERAAAADDDAQIVFRQSVLQPPPPESGRSRPQVNGCRSPPSARRTSPRPPWRAIPANARGRARCRTMTPRDSPSRFFRPPSSPCSRKRTAVDFGLRILDFGLIKSASHRRN